MWISNNKHISNNNNNNMIMMLMMMMMTGRMSKTMYNIRTPGSTRDNSYSTHVTNNVREGESCYVDIIDKKSFQFAYMLCFYVVKCY